MSGRSVNVTELIDGRGFGRFQFLVALWCGFLVIIDGFDIGTVAYVVPVMAPQWHVSPAGFGPVFLSTLIQSQRRPPKSVIARNFPSPGRGNRAHNQKKNR